MICDGVNYLRRESAHHTTDVVLNSWGSEKQLTQSTPVLLLVGDSNARELQHTQLHSSHYMPMIAGVLSVRIRPEQHAVGGVLTLVWWYLALPLTHTSHSGCINASLRLLYLP